MRYALLHLDLSTRLALFVATQFFVYYWSRYVVAPAKVGRQRILRAVPVVAVLYGACFLFHPKIADEYAFTLSAALSGFWIGSSKLLAFCVNRGQLVKSFETGNNSAFAVGLLFPVIVDFEETPITKKDDGDKVKKKSRAYEDVEFKTVVLSRKLFYIEVGQLAMRIATKLLMLNVLEYGQQYFLETGHLAARNFCLVWFLYQLSSCSEDILSLVLTVILNLKFRPACNNPFLAQSVTDFWSQRYNVVYAEALRDTVYDPICEGRLIPGSKYFKHRTTSWRKVIATFMTFLMSGFFHAVSGVIAFDVDFPYLYGLFFVAHGIVVLLEGLIKTILKKTGYYESISSSIPSFVYIAYMTAVVFYLVHNLLMVDILSSGVEKQMLKGSYHKLGILP